jgi:hypothetical protein
MDWQAFLATYGTTVPYLCHVRETYSSRNIASLGAFWCPHILRGDGFFSHGPATSSEETGAETAPPCSGKIFADRRQTAPREQPELPAAKAHVRRAVSRALAAAGLPAHRAPEQRGHHQAPAVQEPDPLSQRKAVFGSRPPGPTQSSPTVRTTTARILPGCAG